MDEMMSSAVREALNDPVKRFRLIDAYLARKAEELETESRSVGADAAASDERSGHRRRPRPRSRPRST